MFTVVNEAVPPPPRQTVAGGREDVQVSRESPEEVKRALIRPLLLQQLLSNVFRPSASNCILSSTMASQDSCEEAAA